MITYLYSSTSLSQSSLPLVLWDTDSSYLNGTFPFLRGLGSQPSQPRSHSVSGTSKHCQSAWAAPSPPFAWLLVYLGSREWWWAPSGKFIIKGIVHVIYIISCQNGDRECTHAILFEPCCETSSWHTGLLQQHLTGTSLNFKNSKDMMFYCTCLPC